MRFSIPRRLLLFLFAATTVAAPGCATTVHASDVRAANDEHSQWNSFFLWGAVGEADVDIPTMCGAGRGAASMTVSQNFGTVVLGILTLGIYSPQMAYVTCGDPISPSPAAPPPAPQPQALR